MKPFRITKPRILIHPILALITLLALLLIAASLAEAEAFDLSWWTVNSGGGTSHQSAAYSLDGSIGQPNPSPALSGSNFTLQGGFWGVGETGASNRFIYLPLVRK